MSEVLLDPGKQFQLRQMWAQETWTNSSRVQVYLKAQNDGLSVQAEQNAMRKKEVLLSRGQLKFNLVQPLNLY